MYSAESEMDQVEREISRLAEGDILNRAMIRVLPESSLAEKNSDIYGLLALSKDKIVFKHFANHNWLSSLMSNSTGAVGNDKEITLVIDRRGIIELTRSLQEGFWRRLLGGVEPVYSLTYRDDLTREKETLVFAVVHAESGEKRFFRDLTP